VLDEDPPIRLQEKFICHEPTWPYRLVALESVHHNRAGESWIITGAGWLPGEPPGWGFWLDVPLDRIHPYPFTPTTEDCYYCSVLHTTAVSP
jgi:hypothetical protein